MKKFVQTQCKWKLNLTEGGVKMDIMKAKRMIFAMVNDTEEGNEWADLFEFVSDLHQFNQVLIAEVKQ